MSEPLRWRCTAVGPLEPERLLAALQPRWLAPSEPEALWWPPAPEEARWGFLGRALHRHLPLRQALEVLERLPLPEPEGSPPAGSPRPRWLLALPFPGTPQPARLWLPRHALARQGDSAWLLTVAPAGRLRELHERALDALQGHREERAPLLPASSPPDGPVVVGPCFPKPGTPLEVLRPPPPPPPPARWRPEPTARWRARLHAALRALRNGEADKLVVGRWAAGRLGELSPPERLLAGWPGGAASQRFAWSEPGRGTLLGACPERLLRLGEGLLRLDALAGTALRPDGFGPKEREEQAMVVRLAERDLRALGLRPEPTEAEPVRRGTLWHLRSEVRAPWPSDASLGAALTALHPSAATCGLPRPAALRWLSTYAPPRGLFAGAVGWLDGTGADLWVVLRSAHLRGRRARWWSGAGMLRASDPAAEEAEVLRKLAVAARALGLAPAGAARREASP